MTDHLLVIIALALLLIASQQQRPEGWRGAWSSLLEVLVVLGLALALVTRS